MKQPTATPLLSMPQAAQRLGISSRKLWSLAAAGEISTLNIGRRRLIAEGELSRYIDRLAAGPQAGSAIARR